MNRLLWQGLGAIALVHGIACSGSSSSPSSEEPAIPLPSDSSSDPNPTPTPTTPPTSANGEHVEPNHEVKIAVSVIHDQHRAIPGVMFGGWGPHLGHLVHRLDEAKAIDETWFVDDACAPGACNVNTNSRVDFLRRDNGSFTKVDSLAIPPGIQQNTGAILSGDTVFIYGIDVVRQRLVECTKNLATGAKGCIDLPGATPSAANYVGAALSPRGFRMTWYTTVVDGGGGSFSYLVNYGGGGWNGPRTGPVGGYNDASYINIAFGSEKDAFTMHGQMVSGMAPAWSFVGSTGMGSLAGANAVVWSTPFKPLPQATVTSTNDIAIDPVTGDTHLIARTSKGDAAYYFAPKGKPIEGPFHVFEGSARARLSFIEAEKGKLTLALSRSKKDKGLAITLAPTTAGVPVKWDGLAEIVPTLPAGYENLLAIYSASSVYQSSAVQSVELALVGKTENQVLYVRVDP